MKEGSECRDLREATLALSDAKDERKIESIANEMQRSTNISEEEEWKLGQRRRIRGGLPRASVDFQTGERGQATPIKPRLLRSR
jgi:hypothetical protein